MRTRKYISLLLVMLLTCATLLSACGGKSSGEALTEEGYLEAAAKLEEHFAAISSNGFSLDPADTDAALELLESMKAPLEEFTAIVPPEAYAAAHEKLLSGSQSMIACLDTMINMMSETTPAEIQSATEAMLEQFQTASHDLMAGTQLLAETAE